LLTLALCSEGDWLLERGNMALREYAHNPAPPAPIGLLRLQYEPYVTQAAALLNRPCNRPEVVDGNCDRRYELIQAAAREDLGNRIKALDGEAASEKALRVRDEGVR
jgi:hypothetical protein